MKNKISLNKFSQIPLLYYKKVVFNVHNFDINNLNKNILSQICLFEKLLIERTEQQIVMNIIFDKNCLKIKDLRKYEDIAWFFYNEGLLTKYINSKDFVISFPQLFNKVANFNCIEEDIEAIFSYNSTEKDDGELISFLEKNNSNANKLKDKIFKIEDIQTDVSLLKRKTPMPNLKENLIEIEKSGYSSIEIGKYKKVAFGGSFDHAHIGHNLLLTTAALASNDNLFIGVTSNEMLKVKDKEYILQPFEQRVEKVKKIINLIGFDKKIEVSEIKDTLGGTGNDKNLEALVVTEETLKGGELVNQTRKKNNLKPVDIIIARIVFYKGQYDLEHKISSRKIREGIKTDAIYMEECFEFWKQLTLRDLTLTVNNSNLWFSILRDFYSQFWRKYHTMKHIYEFLTEANILFHQNKIKDTHNFLFAIWFHDSIYVPSRKDNEERSNFLFNDFYNENKNYLDHIDSNKVNYFIQTTKYHSTYIDEITDNDLKYFLDIDMSIFSIEYNQYISYIQQVRNEFSLYNDAEWKEGRILFLRRVINRKYIFYTEEYRNKSEKTARENILREIESYNN